MLITAHCNQRQKEMEHSSNFLEARKLLFLKKTEESIVVNCTEDCQIVCTDHVQCLQVTLGWSGLPDAGRFNFGLGHHEQIQVTQASSDGPRWQPIFVCPHGRRPDLACPAAGSASHFVQTETEANRPPANSTRNGQPRPKNTQLELEVSLMGPCRPEGPLRSQRHRQCKWFAEY